MNHQNELIMGFDAREMWMGSEEWDEERKSIFLYRLDIDKVISTDSMVWPPVSDIIWEKVARSIYAGPYDCWENLVKLEEYIEQYRSELKSKIYYIVLFTMAASVCCVKDLQEWDKGRIPPYDDGLEKNSVEWSKERGMNVSWDDNWKLFGYDVSDRGGSFSGLSNIGVQRDNRKTLREKWGPHLNKHHLFEDITKAVEFKEFMDKEVPSHAPFYVYGIWFVKEWVG